MGQIHYNQVSRDELLAMTPTIVVVKPSPRSEQHSVELGEGNLAYDYKLSEYELVEFLRPARAAEPGEAVVLHGFRAQSFDLHVAYHVRGLSKSPVWRGYEPEHRALRRRALHRLVRCEHTTREAALGSVITPRSTPSPR